MTSQGTAHGRFTRAIRDRHLRRAEMAAREMGELSLTDAFAFCLLLAEFEPERYSRAAARWHAQFVLAAPGIGSADSMLALSALCAIPERGQSPSVETLRQLARRYGVIALS